MTRVAVAGAGIAGLSIAHAIRQRDPGVEVIVFERAGRAGGNIRTEIIDGYTCEWGPDGFLDNAPATLRLVDDLGLTGRLQPSRESARRRFIFRDGTLHEVPLSLLGFASTKLLSWRGKLRVAGEPFAGPPPEGDETIHEFATRRIGREAADVMIDSMVSGIFAGDATALSLRACFPRMWQLESDHGSLVRALIATRKQRRRDDAVGAPAGHLTSFQSGMAELTDRLAQGLAGSVRLGAGVEALRKGRAPQDHRDQPTGFRVTLSDGTHYEPDAVVLTGPAGDAGDLIRPFDATLASLLSEIASASLTVICLGYDEGAVAADRGALDGFGFLVPRGEGIRLLGALWETSIYPHRAPGGKTLIRAMIGGARDPEAVKLTDDALVRSVREDLRTTMGLSVAPEFVRIIRHRRGIPQYTVGHLARLQRIDTLRRAHGGLFLAGNSYRGVAVNSCIAEAGAVAHEVLAHLRALRPSQAESSLAFHSAT